MARRLRFVPKGSLVEVSIRTIQGRFLLTPSKQLNEILIGIIGRAQAKYRMVIHAFQVLSDHLHILLSPESAKHLAQFMCFVDGNIAREGGRLARWKEKFWGRRYQAVVISNEEEAQVKRLKYILANGCKEGLVASPKDWPGASVVQCLLSGVKTLTGKWFDRTKEYRSRLSGRPQAHATTEVVTLSALPCWSHLSDEEVRERVGELVREIEEETRVMHRQQGTSPLGAEWVLKQDLHRVPKDMKRSPAPMFIAASRQAMQELREAYAGFVASFRSAAEKLRAGHAEVRFPPGSFPPSRPFVPEWAPG